MRLTLQQKFNQKWIPEPFSGCWLWEGALFWNGYGRIKHDGKYIGAHRASWIVHYGNIPDGAMVLHKCDVRPCVNPNHLYIGTAADNISDSIKRGRYNRPSGSRHHAAKLTDAQVREIRSLTIHPAEIANRFGISRSHAINILNRRKWKSTERKQNESNVICGN